MNIIEAGMALERGEHVFMSSIPNEIIFGDCKWMLRGYNESISDWMPSTRHILATDWEIVK